MPKILNGVLQVCDRHVHSSISIDAGGFKACSVVANFVEQMFDAGESFFLDVPLK